MKHCIPFLYALLLVLAATRPQTAKAQLFGGREERLPVAYIGPGFGLDHGGLGLKGEIYPVAPLSVFAGFGFNFAGAGVNAGLSYKILPDKRATPTITGMYGYNAVLSGTGTGNGYKVYYGPSVGAGAEIFVGRNRNKLDMDLYYPIRDKEFRQMAIISVPINISFGFSFAIGGDREHRR